MPRGKMDPGFSLLREEIWGKLLKEQCDYIFHPQLFPLPGQSLLHPSYSNSNLTSSLSNLGRARRVPSVYCLVMQVFCRPLCLFGWWPPLGLVLWLSLIALAHNLGSEGQYVRMNPRAYTNEAKNSGEYQAPLPGTKVFFIVKNHTFTIN